MVMVEVTIRKLDETSVGKILNNLCLSDMYADDNISANIYLMASLEPLAAPGIQ